MARLTKLQKKNKIEVALYHAKRYDKALKEEGPHSPVNLRYLKEQRTFHLREIEKLVIGNKK